MANDAPVAPVTKVQDVISSFRPTKLFKSPSSTTHTSIDFDDSGEFLLLSRTDDTIQLFNARAGAAAKELKSQKYGSALARFTHHATSILYASTKVDDGIRYLSMHDNTFIRYFKGHTARVTSLSVSPSNDTFMSASLDGTVRLWDCRTQNATGMLEFEHPYLTAYDPSASVIAIASPPAQSILLYDLKNYDKPPFASFDLHDIEKPFSTQFGQRAGEGWTSVEFSNNGKYILVATNGPGHYLIDAYNGDLVHYLHRPSGATSHLAPGDQLSDTSVYTQADACLTPDGKYVVSGNGSQTGLSVWDCAEREKPNKVLEPMTELPSDRRATVVGYNPRHNMVASAEKEVMLWIPDMELA